MTERSLPANVQAAYDQVYRLAMDSTGGSVICEDFLFAWYNVQAWGGWGPHTIANLDRENAGAILTLLASVHETTWYPASDDMDRLARKKRRKPLSR